MFAHRLATNWKSSQKLAFAVLAFAVARVVLEEGFGWPPLNCIAVLKLAFGFCIVLAAGAFAKTLWEFASTYLKQFRTFVAALRKFTRDYWSSKTAAI